MIIGHIMFISIIIFSIWAIFKTWSSSYKEYIGNKVERLPTFLQYLYPKKTNSVVTEMRFLSIFLLIFFLILEILIIVRS
jgi:hypothetical protein